MIGYKVFNSELKCRGFQFEVGREYVHDGEISMCSSGFHFCENLIDCFNYYSFDPRNRVCKVVAIGKVECNEDGDTKFVTDRIFIEEEIDWYKVLDLVNSGNGNSGNGNSGNRNSGNRNSGCWNSGDWNSGDRNSGNWNSGNRNSGNRNSGNRNSGCRNSGDWNSGDWNSGDWNSGDWNSGYFNSKTPETIYVFNKPCKISDWFKAIKPSFISFDLTEWIPDKSRTEGGFFKTYSYKEAWKRAYEKASRKDVELLKKLPNFDADVFYEISGIRIKE